MDGSATATPLTDGLLVLRHLFGFTGETLVGGALSAGATRTDPVAIAELLAACEATMLDVDGDGAALALTDGVLALRRLFGFTGSMLIGNAVGVECTRCTAEAIEAHLASHLPPP